MNKNQTDKSVLNNTSSSPMFFVYLFSGITVKGSPWLSEKRFC